MYQVVGERQGVDPAAAARHGPERHAEGVPRPQDLHLPARPSLRLVADTIEYSLARAAEIQPDQRLRVPHAPGRLRRRAGDRDHALNASAYLQAVVDRGLPVDSSRRASRSTSRRCATSSRRSPSTARRGGSGRESSASGSAPRIRARATLRLFSGGDGTSLTAVEPHNNIVRIAHAGAGDRPQRRPGGAHDLVGRGAGVPTEESALLALRTQQILAYETGVARTADPLGGSYYVESLTDELERRIEALIAAIEERGGVVAGIEDGSLEHAIADAAYASRRRSRAASRRSSASTGSPPGRRRAAGDRDLRRRRGRRRTPARAARAARGRARPGRREASLHEVERAAATSKRT